MMQIVRMEGKDFTLYCPRSGVQIYDANGAVTAPSFRGYWHIENIDDPEIFDPELLGYWEDYRETLLPVRRQIAHRMRAAAREVELPIDMDEFLRRVPRPEWLAVEFTLTGIAWGSGVQTIWTVLDLEGPPLSLARPIEVLSLYRRGTAVAHRH